MIDHHNLIFSFRVPTPPDQVADCEIKQEIENRMIMLFDNLRDKYPDVDLQMRETLVFAADEVVF